MKLGYSEFSFGYAFTENLIRATPVAPHGAPIFPNLVQEAQLGYDVRLDLPGSPIFFQYKLPQLMSRNSAKEVSKKNLPGISAPFFRMPLMSKGMSNQHQRLIDLEGKFPGTVFYASPMMHSLGEFNSAYRAVSVHTRSVFFSPSEIGVLPDNEEHIVAYKHGQGVGYFCSEPKMINAFKYEQLSGKLQHLFNGKGFESILSASRYLREMVAQSVSSSMRNSEAQILESVRARRDSRVSEASLSRRREQVVENILVAREMARVDLGVDVLIAQPAQ